MRVRTALTLYLALALACAVLQVLPVEDQLESARADLAAEGFEFDADVRFRYHRYAACDGMACADVALIGERRTILLAPEAFESPGQLRATLLEVWERYREPRPGSVPDLARGALRVIRDGERVGVREPYILRRAHHVYRQLYLELPSDEQADLPDPDELQFP